jgi:Prenyltransferase and squalene oxidase repeat
MLTARPEYDAAIARAKHYLEASITDGDHWCDFQTNRSGESDVWVSAYVLNVAEPVLDADSAERVRSFLASTQKTSGGWGYSRRTPADCDSTLHVLLAASTVLPEASIRRAIKYVSAHYSPGVGLSTYSTVDELHAYRGASREDFRGWCAIHDCVTAIGLATSLALKDAFPREFTADLVAALCLRQRSDGSWKSYWWAMPAFVTARVLEHRRAFPRYVIAAAEAWAIRARAADGLWRNEVDHARPCVISSALLCAALARSNATREIAEKSLDALIALQQRSGAWGSAPCLRIPPTDVVDPSRFRAWNWGGKGVGSISSDQHALYTTATVVRALLAFRHI